MTVENLKDALPEYAKDLKLNLGSISRSTVLDTEQLWGTLLASAAATRNAQVLTEISAEAADELSAEAYQAALGAASIMGMNNVFYRGRGFLGLAKRLHADAWRRRDIVVRRRRGVEVIFGVFVFACADHLSVSLSLALSASESSAPEWVNPS